MFFVFKKKIIHHEYVLFILNRKKKSNANFMNEETKVKDRERSSQVTLQN